MSADLAVDALATFRLARLVTTDTITRPIREAIISDAYRRAQHQQLRRQGVNPRTTFMCPDWYSAELEWQYAAQRGEWEARARADDEAPTLAGLVVCDWCVGVWAGLLVAGVGRRFPRVRRALAFAAAAGLIAHRSGADL